MVLVSRRIEIVDGSAVTHHKTLVAPLITQDLSQQLVGTTARLSFVGIVGTHHFVHIGGLHEVLKRIEISLGKVTLTDVGSIELMALVFRTTMHSIMLEAGMQFVVGAPFAWSSLLINLRLGIALQAENDGATHLSSQEWIFTISLLSTSPTRVAEDVDIGSPDRQATVSLYQTFATCLDILDTLLGAGDVHHLLQQFGVKRGCHADGLRKDSCHTTACSAMQSFAPPIVFLDTEFGDGATVVHHQGDLLLKGKSTKQVLCSNFSREFGVLIR